MVDDRSPLLAEEGGIRQRTAGGNDKKPDKKKKWTPAMDPSYNPNLPYGGKVFLARRKKPDPWWVTILEVRLIKY